MESKRGHMITHPRRGAPACPITQGPGTTSRAEATVDPALTTDPRVHVTSGSGTTWSFSVDKMNGGAADVSSFHIPGIMPQDGSRNILNKMWTSPELLPQKLDSFWIENPLLVHQCCWTTVSLIKINGEKIEHCKALLGAHKM